MPVNEAILPGAHLVRVRGGPRGPFTAELVGLPEVQATASTRDEAIEQVRQLLAARITAGEFVVIANGTTAPARQHAGHAKDDPTFDEYLEEIKRYREQVDEQSCPSSSSTPTT